MTERDPSRSIQSNPDFIRPAVILHIRPPLARRNVGSRMQWCCIDVSHETFRYRLHRFALTFARDKGRRICPGVDGFPAASSDRPAMPVALRDGVTAPSITILGRDGSPVSPRDWWLRHVPGEDEILDL